MSVQRIGEFVLWLGAIVGALGVIGRLVVRPLVQFGKRVDKTLTAVRNDLLPNGGGSLRDAVDRIEASQVAIEHRVALLESAIIKPAPASRARKKESA